jgi:hypothetical protein
MYLYEVARGDKSMASRGHFGFCTCNRLEKKTALCREFLHHEFSVENMQMFTCPIHPVPAPIHPSLPKRVENE